MPTTITILICDADEDTEKIRKLEGTIHSVATLALVETIVGFDYNKASKAIQRLGLGHRRPAVVWIDLTQSKNKALDLLCKLRAEFDGILFFVSGNNVEAQNIIRVQQLGYWLGDSNDLTQLHQALLWLGKKTRAWLRGRLGFIDANEHRSVIDDALATCALTNWPGTSATILLCDADEDTAKVCKLEDSVDSLPSLVLVETILGFDYNKASEAIQRLGLGRHKHHYFHFNRIDVVWIDLGQSENKALDLLSQLRSEFDGIVFFVSGKNVEPQTNIRARHLGYWLGDGNDLTQMHQALLWRDKKRQTWLIALQAIVCRFLLQQSRF